MRLIRNWYQLLEGSGLVANDSGPGVAQGTLTANVSWLPFYSPPYSNPQFSGTLSPDATGTFALAGIYSSSPYFFNSAKSYFLWTDYATGVWYVTASLGVLGAAYWLGFTLLDPAYLPVGTATGTGSMTSTVTMPYDQKGVVIASSVSRIVTPAAAAFPAAAGSIEMLVRPFWNNADSIYHYFFTTYGGNNRAFRLAKYNDNLTYVLTDSTSRGSFTFAWTAHQLYHIVLNWGTNELFINNALVKNYTDGGLGTGASTLYIGDHDGAASRAFNGIIYYFIARDVALTLAEITAFNAFFQKLYIPQPI